MSDKYDFPILDMSAPDFLEQFKLAIGLKDGETISIHTPQFKREDGRVPVANPEFDLLRKLPKETLIELGMRNWDGRLWLFPYEWFKLIPQGYEVKCIDEEVSAWDVNTHDDDHRAGCLAYGIVPEFAEGCPSDE